MPLIAFLTVKLPVLSQSGITDRQGEGVNSYISSATNDQCDVTTDPTSTLYYFRPYRWYYVVWLANRAFYFVAVQLRYSLHFCKRTQGHRLRFRLAELPETFTTITVCGSLGANTEEVHSVSHRSSTAMSCRAKHYQPKSTSADSADILTAQQREEFTGYEFCFDSIVFEGGGNKGLAATGAVRVLEELGYWGNIKRFAGASAGSMVAALTSVGYNSHDIERFLRGDISTVFLDAKYGKLSLLPNMLRKYGWHPGMKIFKWFGERVKEKMGDPDLTFEELYKKTKKELCITVTNMNTMDCTYCHVKTTPNMPIRLAVRMSGCIPGVFCPVKVKTGKTKDYFVDGGLLCNFPIHCYDGWYLSMKHEDSFLQRLQPFQKLSKLWDPNERFSPKNENTLGILLYAGDEREVMKEQLVQRFEKHIKTPEKQDLPTTKLADKRRDTMKKLEKTRNDHKMLQTAFSKLLEVLRDSDIDQSGTITIQEFEKAVNKSNSEFTSEDKKLLFGDDFSDTKAHFKRLDINGDGEISFRELMAFADNQGLEMMEEFRGYSRQEITDLRSYFGVIMDCLLLNMKRIFVQGSDVHRTIGINTGYLDTLDFKMEEGDQTYMVQQGKLGCIAFLRELIAEKKMVLKT